MDKQTIKEKAKALETRFDLLNLLNEVKADLLGSTAYPFTMKKLLIFCNPKNDGEKSKSATDHSQFLRNQAASAQSVPHVETSNGCSFVSTRFSKPYIPHHPMQWVLLRALNR